MKKSSSLLPLAVVLWGSVLLTPSMLALSKKDHSISATITGEVNNSLQQVLACLEQRGTKEVTTEQKGVKTTYSLNFWEEKNWEYVTKKNSLRYTQTNYWDEAFSLDGKDGEKIYEYNIMSIPFQIINVGWVDGRIESFTSKGEKTIGEIYQIYGNLLKQVLEEKCQ